MTGIQHTWLLHEAARHDRATTPEPGAAHRSRRRHRGLQRSAREIALDVRRNRRHGEVA